MIIKVESYEGTFPTKFGIRYTDKLEECGRIEWHEDEVSRDFFYDQEANLRNLHLARLRAKHQSERYREGLEDHVPPPTPVIL